MTRFKSSRAAGSKSTEYVHSSQHLCQIATAGGERSPLGRARGRSSTLAARADLSLTARRLDSDSSCVSQVLTRQVRAGLTPKLARSSRQDGVDQAHFLRLPDELIASISRYYNPPIPFELGHFTLPSRYMREGRDELRSMAATCRRLARILRPLLYRTLVFVDDKRWTQTVHFYSAKDIQSYVRELYWQPSCASSSSLASPLLPRLSPPRPTTGAAQPCAAC